MLLSALRRIIVPIAAASELQWLFTLAVVSLVPRLVSVLLISTVPVYDAAWYDERAAELAAGLGYQVNGVPTSYWPPGYPFVLALVYRVFGHSWLAGMLLNALLGVVICLLTYLIATRVVGVARARMAGLLIAFFPSQILFTNALIPDILFTALFLLIIYLLLLRQHSDRHNYLYVAVIGVWVGFATLVRPMLLLFPLVMLIWEILAGASPRRAIVSLMFVLLGFFAVILPWTIRNLMQMGYPVLISTSGGINLWIGNNPEATGTHYKYHLSSDSSFTNLNGEVERDNEARRLALRFIREHPLKALALIPKKVYHLFATDYIALFWATGELRRPLPLISQEALITVVQRYYIVVLGLAAVSLGLLRGGSRHPRILLMLVLGYWVMFHAVFFGTARYHFPIVPLLCIFAAETLAAFWVGANSLYYKSDSVAAAGS